MAPIHPYPNHIHWKVARRVSEIWEIGYRVRMTLAELHMLEENKRMET